MDGVMDCTCMPNMTAMQEDMMDMESMMSASGRAIRYVKKVENGQLRVRPLPVVKDRSQITSAISSAISNALGRSLKPSNKVSKVALRQLFNGGLLEQLAVPATDGGTNIMEDMAMNMVQQQIEQMLASGELETMAMEFMSSGQMEQMIQDFMANPATQQMINDTIANMMKQIHGHILH